MRRVAELKREVGKEDEAAELLDRAREIEQELEREAQAKKEETDADGAATYRTR